MIYHADKQKNETEEKRNKAEIILRIANLEYEVLSDDDKKRKYDNCIEKYNLDNSYTGHSHGPEFGRYEGAGGKL